MALDIAQVSAKVKMLRSRAADRDQRWGDVLEVRRGNLNKVFPSLFSEDYPKPLVANFVDVAARDVAEVIAPLPAFNCSSTSNASDTARRAADKRTMIVAGYRDQSKLQTQMFSGADRYLTYGLMPIVVEIDFELQSPVIRVDNPFGAYPEFDRFGRLQSYTRRYLKPIADLVREFPEFESQIRGPLHNRNDMAQLEMYRYHDKDQTVLFLPQRNDLVLSRIPNPIGRIMVACAVRPGVDSDDELRGQFDDILWVQVARARFATLTLEAAQKSVQAPFAMPNDVTTLEIGPDAIVRSANPEKIRRVDLNVPPGLFTEQALMDQEMRMGARYPEGRQGVSQGSIVTGKGIEALMGGFDTQVKTAQAVLAETFQQVMQICFLVDEKLFGDVRKTVRGVDAGAPYEVTYTPSKDINGNHIVDVTYGMMAGLNPNQALVFGLQARGDGLISRDFLRRQMPWEMNVTQEEQKIEIEKMRDSLINAVASYAQAIPQLASQGQDASTVLASIAAVIKGRQEGRVLEDVVAEAFAPKPVEPEPLTAGAEPAAGSPESPTGSTPNVAMPQQQRPGLQQLLAGLTGRGNPSLSASVQRSVPTA